MPGRISVTGPLLLAGGLWLSAAQAGSGAATAQPASPDEWDGLPADPGREEVFGICGACHSLMIVKQQGLDRESWEETLVWMVEEQGMPELDPETLSLILGYLARHYGIDSRKRAARP